MSSENPGCPECENHGYENPVLDNVWECDRCELQYDADGEVVARAE